MRMVFCPKTGYHKRSPATETLGSSRKSASRPPSIVTIHSNWKVLSDMGSPSLSGYSIAGRSEIWIAVVMIVESPWGRSSNG
jgi:hypothetical protein